MADKATWLGPTEAELAQQIQARFELDPPRAARHAAKVASLNARLRPAFKSFWDEGVLDAHLAVGNWSLVGLVSDRNLIPLAAFATLDWLIREPEEADRTIRAGVHRISLSRQP